MKDLEKWMRERRYVEPSEALDERIGQLLTSMPEGPRALWRRPVPLWQCVAACVLVALGMFFMRGNMSPQEREAAPKSAVVYMLRTPPTLSRAAFDLTAQNDVFLADPDKIEVRYY